MQQWPALALNPTFLLSMQLPAGLTHHCFESDEIIPVSKPDMAIIITTHELGSIQMIADQAVMLHRESARSWPSARSRPWSIRRFAHFSTGDRAHYHRVAH